MKIKLFVIIFILFLISSCTKLYIHDIYEEEDVWCVQYTKDNGIFNLTTTAKFRTEEAAFNWIYMFADNPDYKLILPKEIEDRTK